MYLSDTIWYTEKEENCWFFSTTFSDKCPSANKPLSLYKQQKLLSEFLL
jgi:hypothetical protein